jgi:hypothetical protein
MSPDAELVLKPVQSSTNCALWITRFFFLSNPLAPPTFAKIVFGSFSPVDPSLQLFTGLN